MPEQIFSKIQDMINSLDVHSIPAERKNVLQPLADHIQNKVDQNKAVRLNFICTHNSRRSHLSQVWAQIMAAHFDVPKVYAYSGGTEATALYLIVAEILKEQGLEITPLSDGYNPVYTIKYGQNAAPVIGFSKIYDHPFNPSSDFAAIMTCSQASGDCPFVGGAETRISITYEDPKVFDDTPQQSQKYHERSLQIATELFYVFSKIKG